MTYYNLKAERQRIGMQQGELAEILECSTSSIYAWEKDISNMPSSKLSKAADMFGCSTDYLLGKTDDRRANAPIPA